MKKKYKGGVLQNFMSLFNKQAHERNTESINSLSQENNPLSPKFSTVPMDVVLQPKFYGEIDLKHTLMHNYTNEGTYGCVISPPLNVENAKGNILEQYFPDIEDTDVSKLFGDVDDCKTEITTIIKIYKLFQSMNAEDDFINLTIPIKRTACYSFDKLREIYKVPHNTYNKKWLDCLERKKINFKFKQRNRKPKEKLSSDNIDNSKSCNEDNICEIVYSGAGDTLNYINYNLKKRDNFQDFIGNLIILTNSLDKFNNKIKYVHRDIKPENILFNNNNNGKLSLIDYGLSIESDKIFDKDQTWFRESRYFVNPPEYIFYELLIKLKEYTPENEKLDNNITYIIKLYNKNKGNIGNDWFLPNLTQLSNQLSKNKPHLQTMSSDFEAKKYTEMVNYFLSLENNSYTETLEKIKQYPEKIDIYSLGISLLLIYNNFEKDEQVNKEYIEKFRLIIDKMIETDPEIRYNHKQVIYDLVELYRSMPGDKVNSFNKTLLEEIINQNIKQGGKKEEKKKENKKKIVRKRNIKNTNSLEKNCKYLSKIMILFKDNFKTQKTKPKWKIVIARPSKINNKKIFLKKNLLL